MGLRSGIRNKPIPDPGSGSRGQKAPDPGSGSATLLTGIGRLCYVRYHNLKKYASLKKYIYIPYTNKY
jgi:hypothetical protein